MNNVAADADERRGVTTCGLSDFSEAAWNSVLGQHTSLMQSIDWLAAASDVFSPQGEAEIFCLGDASHPSALAPFYKTSSLSGKRRLHGGIDLGETTKPLYQSENDMKQLIDALINQGKPIDFGHFPNDAKFISALREATNGKGGVASIPLPMRAAPFIILDDTWAEPEKRISRNKRQSLNRKRRKAAELGEVHTEILTPSPDDYADLLHKAIDVESRSWKGKTKTALAFDQQQTDFFLNYGERAARKGELRICFLHIGDTPAAMQVGAVFNNRFWSVKIGYDEQFSDFSPGELLMLDVIRHAVEQKLSHFEFCGKEASWTLRWTGQAQEILSLRYYPYNLFGAVAVTEDAIALIKARLLTLWRTKGRSFSKV